MKKIGLILVIFIIIVFLTEVILPRFLGLNRGLLYGYASLFEFRLRSSIQIKIQQKDALYRHAHPPSQDEINQMRNNRQLCFDDDDCRIDPNVLVDCNGWDINKYFTPVPTDEGFGIFHTLIGCPRDQYVTCVHNSCSSQRLKTWLKI
jgi:hypothetical protein